MLNAEPNMTSDIVSENGSHHTSIAPALPSSHHPSPHQPSRLAQSKSAYGTSSPKGPDPWATTLAAIHQFSSPPDPMRNSPDLSGRPCSAGEPFRPWETAGGAVRTFTVTVVEELPKSHFALCFHDPTPCYYAQHGWLPSRARSPRPCPLPCGHPS